MRNAGMFTTMRVSFGTAFGPSTERVQRSQLEPAQAMAMNSRSADYS